MTGFSAIDFESSIRNWKKGVFSYASTMANEEGVVGNFGGWKLVCIFAHQSR